MKKFIVLYAALTTVMFFVLGCATDDKSREEESGYKVKFEETQLEPSSLVDTEEAPWEAQ